MDAKHEFVHLSVCFFFVFACKVRPLQSATRTKSIVIVKTTKTTENTRLPSIQCAINVMVVSHTAFAC